MKDFDHIITGLMCICKGVVCCNGCKYFNENLSWNGCQAECAEAAVGLIKEQINTIIEKNDTIIQKNNQIMEYIKTICERNALILQLLAERNEAKNNV